MCGISAVINGSRESVELMMSKIPHRGPNGMTVNEHHGAVIGHNRLAITDANVKESNQPGKCGKTVVYFNGEIYNYRELPVYKFGMTEIEVLALGFDRYGVNFVSQLNGMFAIILYYKGEWILIRDRYGIKPLYYWINEQTTYIVSEIKSLSALKCFEAKINLYALSQWQCMNNIVTDDTIFQGVYHVRPGTIVNISKWETQTYWKWEFKEVPINYDLAVIKVRELVTKAVQRQIPLVPYGTCLSGGVDSNIIKHILGDVSSFSVGYSVADERSLIRDYLGYHIVYSDVYKLEQTMYSLENPRVGASWANYGLYELASKFVKVLFDGAGADELFGGYDWRYEGNYTDKLSRTGHWNQICQELMDSELGADTIYDRYKIDGKWFLSGVLEVVDKLSMAHSIEVRLPFLDNELVDFACSLPASYKKNKQILKDAFGNQINSLVLKSPKKGFTSPDWIKSAGDTQAQRWNSSAISLIKKIYFDG